MMRWLTNGQTREKPKYLHVLPSGHEGKRVVIVGDPKPGKYTVDDLKNMGYQGYYEVERCQCDLCRKCIYEEYYKPLKDWRMMNEKIISRKAAEHRAEIREKHTHRPITRRIVLDMGVDSETRIDLCAFIGRVFAMAEHSNMLGYAMHIKRSEEPETKTLARQVYYDLVIDVDVSSTIETALTELMGAIHSLAQKMELIGRGLNIINIDAKTDEHLSRQTECEHNE